MKEYHVTGNQRVNGNFELYVEFDDSRGWTLWKNLTISKIAILNDL